MLIADSVTVKGRHDQLVAPTSLQLRRGEMQLVVCDPQLSRTALALALSGRMKPTSGTLSWNNEDQTRAVRKHSALVDSPEVSAPESHMKVQDVVAEDLALIPGAFWRRPKAKRWMAQHGFTDIAESWIDAVEPARRLELQLLLAIENPQIQLLVVDSPDRHDLADEHWAEILEGFADSHREFAVLAIVSHLPRGWETETETDAVEPTAPEPPVENGYVQEELDLGLEPQIEASN